MEHDISSASHLFLILVWLMLATPLSAKTVKYDLTVAKTKIYVGNESRAEITINGTSPGPVLKFVEGDDALIHVHNELSVPTSIHWHGMLVPNDMDGVPYLTNLPIPPHESYTYKFLIRQSGTYWYHSHFGLQEQEGVIGAIVIAKKNEKIDDGDHVIVLSDWTHECPSEIMRTLKRGSDWYSIEKGTAQSLVGAIRAGRLWDYFRRELLRMPPMDISDVAYDAFLANGRRVLRIAARPGQTMHLRFVNAASMTYFNLQFAGGRMKIVAADGQDVEPFDRQSFLMAVGETYDVLIRVPAKGAYELRATAQDGTGFASIWIGQGSLHTAPNMPTPDLYRAMGNLTWRRVFALTPQGTMGMNMTLMPMTEHKEPYDELRSLHPTNFASSTQVQTIRLTLDGDMKRYVWLMNNHQLSPRDEIKIKKGYIARVMLINRTMMHHPMHLHGHFFRVLNGQGDYDPLKHTIDVPPMSTVVIEFQADATGDWFFHCHFLYHMESGMMRVVHYEGYQPDPKVEAVRSQLYHDPWYAWGEANVLSQMTDGFLTTSNTRNILTAEWEAGWNNVPNTEWESILTYGRYVNRFLTVFTGADILRMGENPSQIGRGIAGLSYLLPLNFESRAWVDSQGGARFYLDKSITLTPRLALMLEGEYDTHDLWYGKVRMDYLLSKSFSGEVEWASDYEWGAGFGWRF